MKFQVASLLSLAAAPISNAFSPSTFGVVSSHVRADVSLAANIRGPTDKSEELRFGWDGSTALGGAVVNSQPARYLDDIRAAGETLPDACEIFNSNVEMSADDLTFEEVMEVINENYEPQLLEFKNGDIVNKPGENDGSARILSYAALSNFDKETTLKLWGQYYREVLADPDGDSHQNIRNFMKYGWEGVPFENGISLTKKVVGENEWDTFSESWIP